MPLWFRLPFGSSGRFLGRVVVNFTASKKIGLLLLRLLLVCWVAVDSSFLASLVMLKQFALPKANYGWVARGPTWTVASSLWATFWVSTRRVRYLQSVAACFFLGEVACTWISLGSLAWWLRSFVLASGLVTLPGLIMGGTCSGALRSWFRSHDFRSVRPWVWRHPVASVEVDLSVRPGPKMLEPLIGLAQHNVREGWRAWVWKKYSRMWQAWGEVPSCLWSNFSFFGYQEHSFVDLVRSQSLPRSDWVPRSVRVLTLVFLRRLVLLLARGGAGALDSGSTSLGSVCVPSWSFSS